MITRVSQENLAGRIVAINGYPSCAKTGSVTLFFIAFLKCSKQNYQLDQALEKFKYSFFFDGIALNANYTVNSKHSVFGVTYFNIIPRASNEQEMLTFSTVFWIWKASFLYPGHQRFFSH